MEFNDDNNNDDDDGNNNVDDDGNNDDDDNKSFSSLFKIWSLLFPLLFFFTFLNVVKAMGKVSPLYKPGSAYD